MSDLGYRVSARLTNGLLRLFTRVKLSGLENIPPKGAVLVCANHISHFDPYYIGPPIPRLVDFMAMEEFFRVPVVGAWLRWANAYPVRRVTDPGATREALRRIKSGRLLGIFPERGLRAGPTSLLGGASLPKGTLLLAHRTGTPVVPCVIVGSDKLYGWKYWLRRITVWIRYGPALLPGKSETADAFQERYVAAMREIYNRLVREERLSEEDLPADPKRRKGKA